MALFFAGNRKTKDRQKSMKISQMLEGYTGQKVAAKRPTLLSWLFVTQMEMGVVGAALGSGIGAFAGFVILTGHFFTKRHRLYWVFTKKGWKELFSTSKNGISEGINDISYSLITLLFNWVIIIEFGAEGLIAMAVVNFLLEIQTSVVFGFGDTLQLLVSSNQGARRYDRVSAFLKLTLLSSVLVGVFFIIISLVGSRSIAGFFIQSETSETYRLIQQVFLISEGLIPRRLRRTTQRTSFIPRPLAAG